MTAHTTATADEQNVSASNIVEATTQDSSSSCSPRSTAPVVHVYPFSTPLHVLLEDSNSSPYESVKYVHYIRHAQGTHNVNKEYRDIANLDARLTEKGKDQCRQLAEKIRMASSKSETAVNDIHDDDDDTLARLHTLFHQTELIVTSPLTRCMQTALLSLEPVLEKRNGKIPVMAHESIRETVNYNCDRRRTVTELQADFAGQVDFSSCDNDHDAIWAAYEERLGSDQDYTGHRESAELHVVAERARTFFEWLRQRPEQHVAICSHAAFSRCLWNFGHEHQDSLSAERFRATLVDQTLDTRQGENAKDVPVVKYCGDTDFELSLRKDFDNCELRSMIVAFVRA